MFVKTSIASAETPAGPETLTSGDLDLQAAPGIAHRLAVVLDRVEDVGGLAGPPDEVLHEGGGPVARELRLLERRRVRVLAGDPVELGAVGGDGRAVGRGQPAIAAEDDDRGRDVAVVQALGDVQRPGRLRVAGQEGAVLVALGVGELARQVRRECGEDGREPDGEDDELAPARARVREEARHEGPFLPGRGARSEVAVRQVALSRAAGAAPRGP
jgi:hypothetical protein